MNTKLKGRYERPFWLRRIRKLIENINELSKEKIDVEAVIQQCKYNDENYCISTYFYFKKKYLDLLNDILNE